MGDDNNLVVREILPFRIEIFIKVIKMPNIAPVSVCDNYQKLFTYYITVCIRHFVIFYLEFQNILAQKI